MTEVYYPDMQKGRRVFATFTDLSFADRALVIVEPDHEFWAMHFIRQGDTLRVFDDFNWMHWRRREGVNHSINYMSYSSPRKAGVATAEDFYKDVGLGGRDCEENSDEPDLASTMLKTLPWQWVHSSREKPGITESQAQSRIEQLFIDHLGVSCQDIIKAGTCAETTEGFEAAKPLSSIALRPLTPICESLKARPAFA